MNDDGWHTLLAATLDRGILIHDGEAAQGQFTKRLISLMKTTMRRNAEGKQCLILKKNLDQNSIV